MDRERRIDALLIIASSVLVVAGAWSAGFTDYDDTAHISGNPQLAPSVPVWSYFQPQANEAYIPITTLSWRLDRILFSDWMPQWRLPGAEQPLGSWAPGVRGMTWLYHVLAALVLLSVMKSLGLGRWGSLFVAVAFVLHPMACETVCWATQRKNALAALFGFSTLWLWLRPGHVLLRTAGCGVLYALALMSKQSALGILPIWLALEFLGCERGLKGEPQPLARDSRFRATRAIIFLLVILCSAIFVYLGILGHQNYLVKPPGGSRSTAVLTDAWILLRYVGNLLLPVHLSAAYAIRPILGFADMRLWIALGALAALVGFTLWATRSRPPLRTVFGWLWFLGALGPSLNLVAIPYPMADRYVYLAAPGFFIVVVETAAGLWSRLAAGDKQPQYRAAAKLNVLGIVAALYLALLGCLAVERSLNWRTSLEIFGDAVEKEPDSAYAHYGLGMSYAQVWQVSLASGDPLRREDAPRFRALWMEHWEAMFRCVDADRQLRASEAALMVGLFYKELGQFEKARAYMEYAARKSKGRADLPKVQERAQAELKKLESSLP